MRSDYYNHFQIMRRRAHFRYSEKIFSFFSRILSWSAETHSFFLTLKIFFDLQNFLGLQIFFWPSKFFLPQKFFWSSKFFSPQKIFLVLKNFFSPKNFFVLKNFFTLKNLPTQKFLWPSKNFWKILKFLFLKVYNFWHAISPRQNTLILNYFFQFCLKLVIIIEK